MNKISDFSERLSLFMLDNGLRVSDISRLTGIHRATLSKYVNKQYKPKEDRIIFIAEKLGINAEWLKGYDVGIKPKVDGVSSGSIAIVGTIACGTPIFAAENIEGYFDVDDIDADFCLYAKGESMLGDGINDGDVVFVKQDAEFNNGDIVAVLIEDEATLKHYFRYSEDILILKASLLTGNMKR